jgi:hypothetical protein|tara:strand:- start:44693 stop:45565 length:873 start_codon:yes stop_codon:yes gene_type:complete
MAEQIQNPLSAYFRAPKMYTTIPSGGRFYGPEILESTDNNEYPVFPMTTKDELMLKNPDALLNGDAVASLIKSCVPAVQQPKSLFSADVDALLIAIRGASGGDIVDVAAECPNCETVTDIGISVEESLATMETLDEEYTIDISNGLKITALPFSYASTVKAGVASFQSTRSMQNISEMTDDMDRLAAFNASFVKLADLNFELLVESIKTVIYMNEEGQNVSINDKPIIREFLENTDNTTGKEIEEFINGVNSKGVQKEVKVQCSNEDCKNHTEGFMAPINFDPVNFFTAS